MPHRSPSTSGAGSPASCITPAACRAASAATRVLREPRAAWTAGTRVGGGAAPSTRRRAEGTGVGAALDRAGRRDARDRRSRSCRSTGARANLRAEVPRDRCRRGRRGGAARRGRSSSSAVKLTGGTEAQRRMFYTSLYHAFLMPSVIDDVDGTYQLAGQPVADATGWHQMSDMSLWDTYRTVGAALRVARARQRAAIGALARRVRRRARRVSEVAARDRRDAARCSARARRS